MPDQPSAGRTDSASPGYTANFMTKFMHPFDKKVSCRKPKHLTVKKIYTRLTVSQGAAVRSSSSAQRTSMDIPRELLQDIGDYIESTAEKIDPTHMAEASGNLFRFVWCLLTVDRTTTDRILLPTGSDRCPDQGIQRLCDHCPGQPQPVQQLPAPVLHPGLENEHCSTAVLHSDHSE